MSDNPDVTPSSDPTAIVEQLQTLTDIEGDLADTALAVVEQDPTASSIKVQAEEQIQVEPYQDVASSETGASATEAQNAVEGDDVDALLENAEAVEDVLEESIPPAPISEQSEAQTAQNTAIEAPTAPIEITTQPDGIAAEASQLLDAVEADLNNPVLPESVVPPAHDTAIETSNEEDTNTIRIDVEEPTVEDIVEAAANPENDGSIPATDEGGNIAPAPSPAPAPAPAASVSIDSSANNASSYTAPVIPPAPQVPIIPQSDIRPEVPLPEGLTVSSPSVLNNADLIHAWYQDPKNSYTVLALFNWSIQRTEINDARAWYNALSVDNPTAVEPLLALITLELALSNFPQVEALFAKALKGPSGGITAAADVSIWKAYLHYIRRQNPVVEGAPDVETTRGTITKAYEFALKECGYDRGSGEIWEEYIKFISEGSAKNQWEIQALQDNLRKLYQRAVCIPLNNLEVLWKAYDTFESGVNKATSKKFLAERSPAYMTARTALREMKGLTEGLPRPILPPTPTFSDSDRQAVLGWKNYLKWEEGNPLVIDDEATLGIRIAYALRKCLSEMRHFPELWHYAATYYLKQDKKDEAAEILKAGVQACPKSFLVTFALAELLEDLSQYPAVHELYQNFLTSLTPEINDLKKTIEREVEIAKGPEIPPVSGDDVNMDGDGMSEHQRMVEERDNRGKLVEERRGKQVEELMKGVNLGWIMYMRFARRAEGIKAARAIFGKARKSPYLTWHVFEASAMMEYHSNKDSAVAIRIFELGLKLFSEDVEYVIKYLQFLLSINDDTNARALFERSALKIPATSSRALWDIWARYEYLYGDLSAVHKLETRFAEVFPNDSPLKRFAQRYTYNGIDQIAARDLGFSATHRPQPQQPAVQANIPLPSASSSSSAAAPNHAQSPAGYKRPLPDSESPRRDRDHRRASLDRSPKRYKAHSPPPPPRRYPDRERDRERDIPPPRERGTSGRYNQPQGQGHGRGHGGRDSRSPFASVSGSVSVSSDPRGPPPPSSIPPQARGPPPGTGPSYGAVPIGSSPQIAGVPPAALDRDRSGMGKPLVWFIGNLPTARAFDGPIFRPDDIVGLFNNIAPTGLGIPGGSGAGMNAGPGSSVGMGMGMGGPPPPMGMSARGGSGYPEPDRRYGGPPPMRGGGRY
ncbi:uncharacterized protein I303_103712 [Kwoniella dejecticola CBS 10117]|uniref:mRNA 3'-end-processing protein RNA14 n=1 Tax=Kwoniella dejecticola CBS 10117 TaxID=1296121 RepID=A0A1A6A7H8_9TREE|nr:uncharacterized protein I303_03728 [Kwoniella dejecticola CBS 10117]OBR86012.1 hypothetical protein I303_03728 [Kwoniella dejecticola CBS 10117]